MTAFFTLLNNDIKLFLKDWKACIILLVTPFIFISFFAYALTPYLDKSSFIEPFSIALVDKENTTQTRMLVKQIEDVKLFSRIVRVDEESALKLLSERKVDSVIIIPPDFTESVSAGENKPVTVIGSKAAPLQSYVVKTLMQSAANLVSAAQSAITTIYHYNVEAGIRGKNLESQYNDSTMKLSIEALSRNEVFSEIDTTQNFNLTPAEYFTAALIVVFMMFAGMPGMKMLVAERSTGVTRRLEASPIRMWQVALSKLMVSIMLSAVQFGVIIAFTSVVFKNYWGAPITSVLLLFGGLVFAVSAWSIFVSSISTSPASADIIANLGILLMAVIGGSIYPLSSMPDFVRSISKLTINRWAMDGFMVLFSGNDAASVTLYATALAVIGLVLFILSTVFMKLAGRGWKV
jgi:ABC-2 type transport system permease protein